MASLLGSRVTVLDFSLIRIIYESKSTKYMKVYKVGAPIISIEPIDVFQCLHFCETAEKSPRAMAGNKHCAFACQVIFL